MEEREGDYEGHFCLSKGRKEFSYPQLSQDSKDIQVKYVGFSVGELWTWSRQARKPAQLRKWLKTEEEKRGAGGGGQFCDLVIFKCVLQVD